MKSIKKRFSAFNLYTLSFLSGICMGITVAPVGAWFLAWIALAPLWVLVMTSAPRRNPYPFALTWAIAYHGVALSWITGIYPMDWLGVPSLPGLLITGFCWAFISLWGGLFASIWATLMVRLDRKNPWLRVLIGTALWCGLERLWSMGFLWWSTLSYSQSPQNLVILHLGQLSGTSTITALIVAINGLIAEAWIARKNTKTTSTPQRFINPYLAAATGIFITSHLAGFLLYIRPIAQPPAAALKVGVVQGNISNRISLRPEGVRRAIEGYTNGYLNLVDQGVDAVLTPEGALPLYQRNLIATPLFSAIEKKGVVAWIGAFGERGRSYTISLFTINGKGETFSRYDKAKLVPLGEYIPFEEIFGRIIERLSPLSAHQVAGSPNQLFDTPLGMAIVGICYESAFPEQFRYQAAAGGQFILSSANDAHYTPAMSAQHHAQDIMRAIESDRWAARATNTGYSAFVDPHGRTLWISGYNTYEIHAETIYRRQTQTLYVRWGDWLTPLLLGLSALGWFVVKGD